MAKTPHVLIVGAGLAGLLLAILLDRANVPKEIQSPSSVDLLEDFKIASPSRSFNIYTGNVEIAVVEGNGKTYEIKQRCSVTVPGNRICWSVVKQLGSTESQDEGFRDSEWEHESNEATIKELFPSSGQGSVNAMQDAVVLANCIYDLRSIAEGDVMDAFRDFKM
ncbi:hypothetical protein BGX26_009217 [Mortierella sp. AD094]|nr:hypothetical protein BGX26_009217 [Mortierella sp. AD094]